MTTEHLQSNEIETGSEYKRKFGIFPLRQVVSFRKKQHLIDSIIDLAQNDDADTNLEVSKLIAELNEVDNPTVKLSTAVHLLNEYEDVDGVDTIEIEPIIEETAAEILDTLETKEAAQSQRYKHYVGPGVGPREATLAFEAYDALPCTETKKLVEYSVAHIASNGTREVFRTAWKYAQSEEISSVEALRELRRIREEDRADAWEYEHLYDQTETASPTRDAA